MQVRHPSQLADGFKDAHTIHNTTELPQNTVGLLFRVTTAGVIKMEDQDGVSISPEFDTGTYILPVANIKLVYSTGTTAVLGPATTVFPLCVKAAI